MTDLVHHPESAVSVAHEDYRDICSFCAEIGRVREHNLLLELMPDIDPTEFILWETEDFVVVPGVGAVCDGYVLITPKDHVLSFGYLDGTLEAQLTALLERVATFLAEEYGHPAVAFEHGAESFRNRGGSCTDHAHMHVFPADARVDLVGDLRRDYELRRVADFLPALRRQVHQRRRPYLWVRNAAGEMWVCDAPNNLSQHIRRVLARQMGRPDEWDWAVFPGIEHMRSTMRRLRDRPLR